MGSGRWHLQGVVAPAVSSENSNLARLAVGRYAQETIKVCLCLDLLPTWNLMNAVDALLCAALSAAHDTYNLARPWQIHAPARQRYALSRVPFRAEKMPSRVNYFCYIGWSSTCYSISRCVLVETLRKCEAAGICGWGTWYQRVFLLQSLPKPAGRPCANLH